MVYLLKKKKRTERAKATFFYKDNDRCSQERHIERQELDGKRKILTRLKKKIGQEITLNTTQVGNGTRMKTSKSDQNNALMLHTWQQQK